MMRNCICIFSLQSERNIIWLKYYMIVSVKDHFLCIFSCMHVWRSNKPPAIKLNSVVCRWRSSWGDGVCCAFPLTSLINTLQRRPAPWFPLWLLIKPLTQIAPLSSPICTLNNVQTRVSTAAKNNLLASNHRCRF